MSQVLVPELCTGENMSIKLIPGAKRTLYGGVMMDGTHKIYLKEKPIHGQANQALLDFLYRSTGETWEIIHGFTGGRKILKKKKNF